MTPHKTNKKAITMKVQKMSDGSNLFKGRFDFNLFKVIRDNFSNHYTVCLEIYFLLFTVWNSIRLRLVLKK